MEMVHIYRVAECHGSRGYIRVKNWLNVEKLGNFNAGKSLFKCFLRVNYLTFYNSVKTLQELHQCLSALKKGGGG